MFADLDEPSGRDPVRVGSKAAALAVGKAAGAAVLPGFVVEAELSREHLRLGAETLQVRGSGGARLVISGGTLACAEDLIAAGSALGGHLVARSSTMLEQSGEWSGAFSSYVGVAASELPKAVLGCWASAFTVAALERQEAAGVEPGSFPMAVLVQPALEPEAGGWAQVDEAGRLSVYGTKGSPAPLLQGWESGHEARYDEVWAGDEMIELIGIENLEVIAEQMGIVAAASGANRLEWALTDQVWVLQTGRVTPQDSPAPIWPALDEAADLLPSVESLVLAPGVLGEEMVLPWAIGGLSDQVDVSVTPITPSEMRDDCRRLTEEVWAMPWDEASAAAAELMADLRGDRPTEALTRLRALRPPDTTKASRLLSSLRRLRLEMVERGVVADEQAAWHLRLADIEDALAGGSVVPRPRLGVGRWEPLVASVVLSASTPVRGASAAAGVGAGRRTEVVDNYQRQPGRRRVVTAEVPRPNLSALIWDAAGLVTASGSPAAHLFEAARALRVPAVCGVDLGPPREQVVAVDGTAGLVATHDLRTVI